MGIIMAAVHYSPAVASRRAHYDDYFLILSLSGAQPLDHAAKRTCMAVGLEEAGKLAHERLQPASQSVPRRASRLPRLMEPKAMLSAREGLPWPALKSRFPLQEVFSIANHPLYILSSFTFAS
jgi:hypothetical protein